MSTRLPIATLTSIRCRPQSFCTALLTTTSPTMSSVRGSEGSAWTVTARYEKPSFATHCALSSPGTLTNGVSILVPDATQGRGSLELPRLRPAAARYECNSPLPPPSAAGLTHAAVMFSPGTLPKREFSGGGMVSRNVTYEMTQPVCDADLHSGICWNEPPTSLPSGTATFVPSSRADTIFDCTGLPSI